MPRAPLIAMRHPLVVIGMTLIAACSALHPLEKAPPSSARPWTPPDMGAYTATLSEKKRGPEAEAVPIDPKKTYDLSELIDLAERTNPETRVAWERARQAAIAAGLAEGTYYPALAATATGAIASVPLPIPTTVVPGGVFRAKTRFIIPVLSLEWLLLAFCRRHALVRA